MGREFIAFLGHLATRFSVRPHDVVDISPILTVRIPTHLHAKAPTPAVKEGIDALKVRGVEIAFFVSDVDEYMGPWY
jgi:hypothetical protein